MDDQRTDREGGSVSSVQNSKSPDSNLGVVLLIVAAVFAAGLGIYAGYMHMLKNSMNAAMEAFDEDITGKHRQK